MEYPNTLNTCTASFTLETQSHILIQTPQCCSTESKHYLPYKRLLSAISHFLLPKCQPYSLSMYAPLHAADACVCVCGCVCVRLQLGLGDHRLQSPLLFRTHWYPASTTPGNWIPLLSGSGAPLTLDDDCTQSHSQWHHPSVQQGFDGDQADCIRMPFREAKQVCSV